MTMKVILGVQLIVVTPVDLSWILSAYLKVLLLGNACYFISPVILLSFIVLIWNILVDIIY